MGITKKKTCQNNRSVSTRESCIVSSMLLCHDSIVYIPRSLTSMFPAYITTTYNKWEFTIIESRLDVIGRYNDATFRQFSVVVCHIMLCQHLKVLIIKTEM